MSCIKEQGNWTQKQEIAYFGVHVGLFFLGIFIAFTTRRVDVQFEGLYPTTFFIAWLIAMIVPNLIGIYWAWSDVLSGDNKTVGLNERWENIVLIMQITSYSIAMLFYMFKTDTIPLGTWGVRKGSAILASVLPLVISILSLALGVSVFKGGIEFKEKFNNDNNLDLSNTYIKGIDKKKLKLKDVRDLNVNNIVGKLNIDKRKVIDTNMDKIKSMNNVRFLDNEKYSEYPNNLKVVNEMEINKGKQRMDDGKVVHDEAKVWELLEQQQESNRYAKVQFGFLPQ